MGNNKCPDCGYAFEPGEALEYDGRCFECHLVTGGCLFCDGLGEIETPPFGCGKKAGVCPDCGGTGQMKLYEV